MKFLSASSEVLYTQSKKICRTKLECTQTKCQDLTIELRSLRTKVHSLHQTVVSRKGEVGTYEAVHEYLCPGDVLTLIIV